MNKSLAKYLIALLLFGSNGIAASMINLNSYEIVMYRTLIGGIMLIFLYILKNKHFTFHKYPSSFLLLCLSGCSLGVSWLFLYEAYRLIGVSLASLGYYCGPMIVMAISPLLFKEKLTKQKLLCFAMVFIGIVLVNGTFHTGTNSRFGIFCALMSAVMYACMLCFNKKADGIGGMENSTLQIATAFLCVFLYVVYKQGFHFHVSKGDLLPLLFIGICNTGIGCYFYFSSIGNIKVQTVAILGYLEPLSAVFFSFLFLKERLLPVQLVGAILIISGAVFAKIHLPVTKKAG